jgi:hypothetical protein
MTAGCLGSMGIVKSVNIVCSAEKNFQDGVGPMRGLGSWRLSVRISKQIWIYSAGQSRYDSMRAVYTNTEIFLYALLHSSR